MVNAKPTLTFGDNQYAAPAASRQRPGGAPAGKSRGLSGFESYLSVAEPAGLTKEQRNGGRPAAAQAGVDARRPAPVQPARTGLPPAARGAMPGYPEASVAGAAPVSARAARTEAQMPMQARQNAPALQGRSEAGAYARSAMETFNGNLGPAGARLSRKDMPRISSPSFPGRYGFGMTDTRKIAADAGGAQARGDGRGGVRSYPAYGVREQNVQGEKSFLTHGFGGGNAELALRSLGYDVRELQPDVTYARRLDSDRGVAVRAGKNVSDAARPADVSEGGSAAAGKAGAYASAAGSLPGGVYPNHSLTRSFYSMVNKGLGSLAAKFESGSEGISAIGFDRAGGTSYGKYQIASRVGTMAAFIEYLSEKAPDIAKRLQAAGPANTGGRSGKMPDEWKSIASEEPVRFEKLQEDFIRTSHFEPALRSLSANTGIGFSSMPEVLQEVLFSTAVQHGPFGAVRIFSQALDSVGVNKLKTTGKTVTESFKRAGRQLIKQIYALRAGQFTASNSDVQAAVKNRLQQEMHEALGMLV